MQYIKLKVKEKILEIAKEEFIKNGFNNASIRVIVSKSNTSLGNLYRYFKNKEELYDAIVNPIIEGCITNTNSLTFTKIEFPIIASHMANFYLNNKDIFDMLQKGDYNKYNQFLNSLSLVISSKIKESLDSNKDDHMINVLSIAFINGLRTIMEDYKDLETAKNEITILLNIIFHKL